MKLNFPSFKSFDFSSFTLNNLSERQKTNLTIGLLATAALSATVIIFRNVCLRPPTRCNTPDQDIESGGVFGKWLNEFDALEKTALEDITTFFTRIIEDKTLHKDTKCCLLNMTISVCDKTIHQGIHDFFVKDLLQDTEIKLGALDTLSIYNPGTLVYLVDYYEGKISENPEDEMIFTLIKFCLKFICPNGSHYNSACDRLAQSSLNEIATTKVLNAMTNSLSKLSNKSYNRESLGIIVQAWKVLKNKELLYLRNDSQVPILKENFQNFAAILRQAADKNLPEARTLYYYHLLHIRSEEADIYNPNEIDYID